MSPKKKIITIIILAVLFLATAYVCFLNKELVYKIEFANNTENSDTKITGLVEKFEITEKNDTLYKVSNWTMVNDEVEIKIKAPKNIEEFTNLTIATSFQNFDNPTLEAGIKKEVDISVGEPVYDWQYSFLDNQYLNEFQKYMGKGWSSLMDAEKGLMLFQKQHNYETIEDFLTNPPKKLETTTVQTDDFGNKKLVKKDIAQTATVNYKLNQKIDPNSLITELTEEELITKNILNARKNFTNINQSFRGGFFLYTYFDNTKQKNLELSFLKQDLNFKSNEDLYEIKVYNEEDDLVYYTVLDDDGIVDNSEVINIQAYKQTIPLKETGAYIVKFSNPTYDSMIRNININSDKVMLNDFASIDFEGFGVRNLITKPMNLFAMKGFITIYPEHSNASQDVVINGLVYNVDYANRSLTGAFNLEAEINEITTSKNDARIYHNDNPVAVEKEGLFEINPNATVDFKPIGDVNVNYVIAKYQTPEIDGEQQYNKTIFDMENIYVDEDGYINLRLRANGLTGYGNEITINSLEVKLSK